MIVLEVNRSLTGEFLLQELLRDFELQDVIITQEIVNRCYSKIHGELETLEVEYRDIVFSIIEKFSHPDDVRYIHPVLGAGPRVIVDNLPVYLPKIYVGYYK